jgi:uncharacterized membrane protein
MSQSGGLPAVNTVSLTAPFRWLGGAWGDMMKAPLVMLVYGGVIALFSFGLCWALIKTNAAFWAISLTCGFVFIAPMLAMGVYEAGRMIERGERPTLANVLIVKSAFRQDVAYLGLTLLLVYMFWTRVAQIVYGLSTYSFHQTISEFVDFALHTSDGHTMLISGTIVGGAVAFLTYCLVVVSAPMLLDRSANVFAATFTSLRVVGKNFAPMILWAALIVALLLAAAPTGFLAFTIIIPWLGLASWRAYRDLVCDPQAANG